MDPPDAAAPPLLALLAQGERASGSVLAARLGIGRAAIWKQVERLRSLGLAIIAQPGGGYRLAWPFERLDAAAIESGIAAAERAKLGGIAVHWQLDSTNSELLRHVARDPRDRLACVSELQTRGRGRRGRAWHLPLGGGIALSYLKRFDCGVASLAGLSLVAGIAVVRALEDCGITEVALKWPNDLVARGAKLGGILVELGGDALGPCHAVVGIGLNVALDRVHARSVDQAWIDLATLARGAPPSRNQLLARVLTQLVAALDRFANEGFASFAPSYGALDALRGREVRVLHGAAERHGIARGIDDRGALRVAFAEGEQAIDSGEVSVRLGVA